MNEFTDLKIGDELTNDELTSVFKCGPQGGMRKSNATNTLVLVSDLTQSSKANPYKDKWINGILHYTGMGLKGDQSEYYMQNRTLVNLKKTKTKAFLFEKKIKTLYRYLGQVELSENYYFEEQIDADGKKRRVVKFPLKIIS